MSGSQSGNAANPWIVAVVVTIAAFMEVLDTTIVNVSLPYIGGSLAVSRDNATWSLTTYLVANGIVLTISSSLSRRIGQKRYFILSIAGFTAASLACGLSTNFIEILLFRGLQGLFGGGLQPTQQAIILKVFPPEQRQQAFSITAVATIIAPVVGPLVGGYLTDTYSWHWVFLINVPIGTLTIFAVLHVVPPDDDEEKRNAPPFDYWGTLFIALALGCMEVGIDRGEDYDWLGSNFIRVMAVGSVIGYVGGVTYLLRAKNPVVNLRAFKDRNFALGWICIALMGFVLYASAVILPQFSQEQLGYNAIWAGLMLAPGAVILATLIPLVGLVLKVVPVKYVIVTGGLALSAAMIYSMNLVADLDFFHLCLYRGAQTAALALLFVPISSAAYSTLPKALNEDAASLFSMARNVYGGVGISVATALVTDHLQIRQAHLVGNLNGANQPYNDTIQQLQQSLAAYGSSMQQAIEQAPNQIFLSLEAQASVLAYMDVFEIIAVLTLSISVAGLFMSNAKPQGGGGAA